LASSGNPTFSFYSPGRLKVKGFVVGYLATGEKLDRIIDQAEIVSREILPLEIAPVFKPKLVTCVRNGAFSGITPKTRLQEVTLAVQYKSKALRYESTPRRQLFSFYGVRRILIWPSWLANANPLANSSRGRSAVT